MGYMYLSEADFRITADNKAACLNATKKLEGKETWQLLEPHFSWVCTRELLYRRHLMHGVGR